VSAQASNSEAELRRQYIAAAEAHREAVRQLILGRETATHEARERLYAAFNRTKLKTEATFLRLIAVRSTV
jgi:hypothetical protein